MPSASHRLLSPTLLLLIAVLLTACAPPPSSLGGELLTNGPLRYQEAPSGSGPLSPTWWKAFGDSELNRDVQLALSQNLAQRQLGSRIDQAAASLRIEGAALFPQIDLASSLDSDTYQPGDSDAEVSFGSFFSWEADLWGRLQSGVRAREAELAAAFQDWLGGRLLLAASVTETRFLILELRARLQLLEEQTATNQTLLRLVKLRVGQGLASRVDLLQQERQLDATRALIPPADADLAAARYALDILLGQSPGTSSNDSRATLPTLPPLPRSGVPANLLTNRPDLLADWNRILARDAEVGQALADQLPRLTLTGGIGVSLIDSVGTFFTNFAAEATAPLFDGGQRQAEVKRRQSLLEESILGYGQNYLQAIGDVETALVRERKQAERIQLTERQLDTARETLDETRIRYSQGLTDYLPVIDALTAVQSLELTTLSLRREALTLRVALHRALGGPMPQTSPPNFPK